MYEYAKRQTGFTANMCIQMIISESRQKTLNTWITNTAREIGGGISAYTPDTFLTKLKLIYSRQHFKPEEDQYLVRQIQSRWSELKPAPQKTLSLSAKAIHHIFEGDTNPSTGTPTGYHSEIRPSQTHDTNGTPDSDNLYNRTVYLKDTPAKVKADQSTFFPSSISEKDIIDAIEFSEKQTPTTFIITRAGKLNGIHLLKTSADTIYPYIP